MSIDCTSNAHEHCCRSDELSGHLACSTPNLGVGRFPSDSPLQKPNRALYARVDFPLGPQAISQKTSDQIGIFLGLGARPGLCAAHTFLGDLQTDHAGIALGMFQFKCASANVWIGGLADPSFARGTFLA